MSRFEINRIIFELIRAILRFRFSFPRPTMYENNFQILFKSTTKIQKKRTLAEKLTDLWPLTLQKQNGRGRLNF